MGRIHFAFSLLIISLSFSFISQAGSCRNAPDDANADPAGRKTKLAKGVWGGQHIRMEVTDNGAQIEYDCANSTLDEPIVLDRSGKFHVKGKYIAEHGGPVRNDEVSKGSPVRYVGTLKGNGLTLIITNTDTGKTVGSFNLTRGNEGRVMKCL